MRLVVKPHRPVRQFLTAVICIVLMSLAGWLLFDYGHWRYIYDRMAANGGKREIWDFARQTEHENENLREQLAIARRTAEMDKEALSVLQSDIRSSQSEILELREELEFYRNTVTGENAVEGLNIHKFSVYAGPGSEEFAYKLVLTRVVADGGVSSGKLDLSITGTLDSADKRFELSELQGTQQDTQEVEIKNFRRMEGRFALPEGFKPKQVVVKITDKNKKKILVQRAFDWAPVTE